MIKESLSKPYQFTDFVQYVNDKHEPKVTIRKTGKKLPRGIYQLYLPGFHIFYVGISKTNNGKGIANRFYAHAQKLTGWFKGAKDTKEFGSFRLTAATKGFTPENILDHVKVYFIPCNKMKDNEIEAWETIIFNNLRSKNQCICNSAKKLERMDNDTIDYILNQQYLND